MNEKKARNDSAVIPLAQIEQRIFSVRGQRVMLDSDLADLYAVGTRDLNRAVKRNAARFPPDFMFELTKEESESLLCQIGTANSGRGGRRNLPFVFTEQGVAMLSSVLRSERAVRANVTIMRAFVRMREMLISNSELARKLEELEARYDVRFRQVFEAIRDLMNQGAPIRGKQEIGFRPPASKD